MRCGAQGPFSPLMGTQSGRFIEAPRGIEQKLSDAKDSLDQGRWGDGVVQLGDLLARANTNNDDGDLAGQDFFLAIDEITDGTAVSNSLLRQARKMIGELSVDAMEIYELRYGAIARKMLTEAAAQRDWQKVSEVRRRYFHTHPGYEASWLLAQREFYLGRPLAASLLLDEVATQPRAIRHLGNHAFTLHAIACLRSGRPLPSTGPVVGQSISIPGKEDLTITIESDDQFTNWLNEHCSIAIDYDPSIPGDHAMFGGSPDRNGTDAGQMPLTNLRWRLPTTATPLQDQMVNALSDELASTSKLPPPSWTPLKVGNQLLMKTTERLVGVDYRTGKRVWTYPWQASFETLDDDETSLDQLAGEDNRAEELRQRIWNDVPYGQVTSDGERAFMLTDLAEVSPMSLSPLMNMRGTRPADTRTNTLVALEMATEGKLLWRLGQQGDQASPYADAFFLGPPLPLEGLLYVLVEIAGDINLCCLEPTTGSEVWRQHLVAVESGGIDLDPIRRVSGAMPTYHSGVLICPTGAGTVVAIDLADRMLRWGASFERSSEATRVHTRGRGFSSASLMQRWDNGVAVTKDTTVLVTPPESEHLFAFDLMDGSLKFPPKDRINMRYLAGIRDNKFYVVGADRVRAYDLDSGAPAWTSERDMLSAGQQINGRGLFGNDDYLLPTTTNQLIRLSLADGSVLQRRSTKYPLGNMIAVDGEVIVQGPDSLSVAFGEASLEPVVNRMLSEDPDNFEALVRKSELLIQRGQRIEAMDYLQRARVMQPANDEVLMLSVSAMLGVLRDDPSEGEKFVDELTQLIDQPAQAIELLSLRAQAAMKQGDPEVASERLIELSFLLLDEKSSHTIAQDVISDPTRFCSLDAWVAARMSEVHELADRQQKQRIRDRIDAACSAKLDSSVSQLRQLSHQFEGWHGIGPVKRELIRRHRENEEYLAIERLLIGSRVSPILDAESFTPDELVELCSNYADAMMYQDAAAILEQLSQIEGLEPNQIERLDEITKLTNAVNGEYEWPAPVTLKWPSTRSPAAARFMSTSTHKTATLSGLTFDGWRLVTEPNAQLAIRDSSGGSHPLAINGAMQNDSDYKEANISGGLMMITMASQLMCIDLAHVEKNDGEGIMWTKGLTGDGSPLAQSRRSTTPFGDEVVRYNINASTPSKVISEFTVGPILGDRIAVLQGGDLYVIDLMTSETIWRNSTAPKGGNVVCKGNQIAVVSESSREIAIFDLRDGRLIEKKPWTQGFIWESAGPYVLAYSATDPSRKTHNIRLVDPFNDAVVLEQESLSVNRRSTVAPSAYGDVSDGRYLGWMQSDGQALIWDLVTGKEISRPETPVIEDLQGIKTLRLDGQLLLLPRRKFDRTPTPGKTETVTNGGAQHQTMHAAIAVDLQDGSVRWTREFDEPWGCTLTQPADTPLMLLTRSPVSSSISTRVRKKWLDLLAIDVQDGKDAVSRFEKPIHVGNNALETRIVVQGALNRMIANIGTDEVVHFRFGPLPPGETTGEEGELSEDELSEDDDMVEDLFE
ncbi:PQQ enzyme repeat protein [Rubripirellula amarantea]|uniref:PQQ enzyme repeat protein n=2 Tax=Rubripirellula amarantea TaxID=2527999 RepID=A0A5C5WX33_9BACT|nr:PQQ enzyme repeat protein [Rubripirellula amarantea]